MSEPLEAWQARVESFASAAHELFAKHETGKSSRVISLTETWHELEGLSLLQDVLFRDALLCLERGLYRAAHVMAWAAFMDFLEDKLAEDGLVAVHRERPKWKIHKTAEELRENVVEFQLLDVARDVGLLSKTATKSLQGMLSKRNECAHPSTYEPGLNEALGYASELLERIKQVQSKTAS
jgi:hypothetical protein